MSLNSAEINQVLSELDINDAFIQNIFQPDFNTLLLELYKDGLVRTLLMSLNQSSTRIHQTSFKFSQKGTQQRFSQLLRSRVRDGKIRRVWQTGLERVVSFEIEKDGQTEFLVARLWGNAANILLLEKDQTTIIDSMFRRPTKNEVSGGSFAYPLIRPDARVFEVRDFKAFASFTEALDQWYTKGDREFAFARLKEALTKQLGSVQSRFESNITQAEDFIAKATSYESFKYYGDLITSQIHAIVQGQLDFETEDWFKPGNTIKISLNPAKTAPENAEFWYQKYQKAKEGIEHKKRSIESFYRVLGHVEQFLKRIEASQFLNQLVEIQGEIEQILPKSKKQDDEDQALGARFNLMGFLIIVGRSAIENDELLRRNVRGNDLWLHARDVPGSYVFIKTIKGKTVPLEVLLDAAHLAVWYSKSRNATTADVYYTHVKYLRRAKDGPKGLVIPTQEKNLVVKIDPVRLSKILEHE